MKAAVLHEYGPASNLKFEDSPDPTAAPGEVLVRITAAGVNPIDWKIRSGMMKDHMPLPLPTILGYDLAGVVLSLGEGVEGFTEGDKVFARTPHAYAQLAAVKAADLVKVPEGLELTTAAALGVITNTGDQLILEQSGAKAGDTVLLTGALGSVGRVALYAAKEAGIKVIAGVRKKQFDEALALGATSTLDISDDDAIAKLGTVDAVCDAIGGDLASKLLPHVKQGGVYASIVGPPKDAALHPTVQVHAFGSHPDPKALAHYAEAIRDGKLEIPIGLILPLAEAAKAHEAGEKGGVGKIILTT